MKMDENEPDAFKENYNYHENNVFSR